MPTMPSATVRSRLQPHVVRGGWHARLLRTMGDIIAPGGKGDGRLCVVNYHRVLEHADPLLETEPDIATFRWQMELLADAFNVVPLHEALAMLENERMPARTVCITFDDGYRSVHDLALPILKELKLPATVFVTSGCMDDGRMWNDRIIAAIKDLPGDRLDLRDLGLGSYPLGGVEARKQAVLKLTEASKYLPPADRDGLIQRLDGLVGGPRSSDLMLTRDMVATLSRSGVEIGGHTISHPILTSLDDDVSRREIAGCKRELEEITGKPVRYFAYPNGKVGMDFDHRHVQMAKDAGYEAAFTTAVGPVTRRADPYQLPRSRPWDRKPFMFGLRLLRWLAGK